MNFRSFIQPSETLLVEITGIHILNLIFKPIQMGVSHNLILNINFCSKKTTISFNFMMSYYDVDFNPKSIMNFLHLCENDLLGSILLTYRIFHSCETGMLTILVVILLIFWELILLLMLSPIDLLALPLSLLSFKFFIGEGKD